MPEGLYFQAAQRYPHMFATLSPTYMGIAQAAYDFTVAYLRGEMPDTPPVKRRMYPTKQIAVAEMRIKLEQTRALFLQTAREARVDPDKDARMRLLAAHYTIMENANDICRVAVRTCGGQAMLKSLPLEAPVPRFALRLTDAAMDRRVVRRPPRPRVSVRGRRARRSDRDRDRLRADRSSRWRCGGRSSVAA